MPLGSEEVVMLTGGTAAAMATLNPCDAVWAGELESSTCTVIGKVPDCVGVPAIKPDEAVNVTPVGREPEVMNHV